MRTVNGIIVNGNCQNDDDIKKYIEFYMRNYCFCELKKIEITIKDGIASVIYTTSLNTVFFRSFKCSI